MESRSFPWYWWHQNVRSCQEIHEPGETWTEMCDQWWQAYMGWNSPTWWQTSHLMLDGINGVSDRLLPLYWGSLELRYCFRKGDTNGLITIFFSIPIELESQKRILKQKQLFLTHFLQTLVCRPRHTGSPYILTFNKELNYLENTCTWLLMWEAYGVLRRG